MYMQRFTIEWLMRRAFALGWAARDRYPGMTYREAADTAAKAYVEQTNDAIYMEQRRHYEQPD